MESKKQSSPEKISELENSYFELQAYWGMTKHMGGFKATEQLVELCQINWDKYVLVVGCGVGVTPCYLAKRYGCRVVGVDLSEKMVDRSKKRSKREGVKSKVKFRVADAQNPSF
jgi:arsenite methyltransferase